MRIPQSAVIPREKLTQYLLAPRRRSDKSKFLARGGFTSSNPGDLEAAIRRATASCNAVADGSNEYGTFYRVEAAIGGPNGISLDVILVWIEWNTDGSYHFVTLKPGRSRQ